jgi:hypothetical protein
MDNQVLELVVRQNQLFKELAAIDQNISAMKEHRSACVISINQTEQKLSELTEKPKEEAAAPGDVAPANPRKAVLSSVPPREEAVAAEATHIVEDMKKTRKEKTPC